jgi:sortase (surface protein transpeptidase)
VSVNTFREKMDEPGCRWVVSILMLLFVLGFGITGLRFNQLVKNADKERETGPAVATIGDYRITQKMMETRLQSAGDPNSAVPIDQIRGAAQALDTFVTQGLLLQVAKNHGVGGDSKDVLKSISSQLDESLIVMRMQLEMQKKLPQNATDAQFEAEIKKETGKDIKTLKEERLKQLQAQLDDPDQRSEVLGSSANSLAMDAIQSSLNVSDDELRHSTDSYVTRRIFINGDKHKGQDIRKIAEGILAEIKGGKLTFEQAMDKYTEDAVPAGKKAHENTFIADMKTIKVSADFQPLEHLKAGDISDVLNVAPNGVAIYHVDKIQESPPTDFEKNKAQLRKEYLTTLAASTLQADLAKLKKDNAVKWESSGNKALYDWYQMDSSPDFKKLPPAEQKKREQDMLKGALEAAKADGVGGDKEGYLAAYASFDGIWSKATAEEKKALLDQRVELLKDFLMAQENSAARLELADLAAQKKDGTLAFESLRQAAELNAGTFDASGQRHFGDLIAKLDKFKSEGALKGDQVQQIQKLLDDWKKEKLIFEEEQAKQKKQEDEERKKAEEAMKKQKAASAAAKPTSPVPGAATGAVGKPPAPVAKPTPGVGR